MARRVHPGSGEPTPEQAKIRQVVKDYDAGNYERAMELCRSVLTSDPTNLTAHYLMGNICVKTNRTQDAIAQYKYCMQSSGVKAAPEATYAKQALEQIKRQQKTMPTVAAPLPDSGAHFGPMAGSTKGAEEYIQEQTATLEKEAKEKVAVKHRTLEDKIAQIQDEMKQQLNSMPRIGSRRMAQQEAKQDAQEQIKEEFQQRIEQLKKDFQRESDDINQAYQSRISGLTDHYHNVDTQGGNRASNR